MTSTSTGSWMARARSLMKTKAPFSTPTSSGGSLRVVGGDLVAELGHPLHEVLLGDDDLAQVGVVPPAVEHGRRHYRTVARRRTRLWRRPDAAAGSGRRSAAPPTAHGCAGATSVARASPRARPGPARRRRRSGG